MLLQIARPCSFHPHWSPSHARHHHGHSGCSRSQTTICAHSEPHDQHDTENNVLMFPVHIKGENAKAVENSIMILIETKSPCLQSAKSRRVFSRQHAEFRNVSGVPSQLQEE